MAGPARLMAGQSASQMTKGQAGCGGGAVAQGTLLIFHTKTEPANATTAVAANSVG
jgi:hypothetical protein